MADLLTNYQCPSCGGPLHFDETSGKVVCDYCGSTYDIEEIEKQYASKEEKAAKAFEKKDDDWDYSSLNQNWDGEDAKLVAYRCPSCSAELICDETTAATTCPYCGNPTIVSGQLSGVFKPDYIIPFAYSKEQAMEGLRKHYKGKPLLPKAFTSENHIEEMQGIYVPFWLFSGSVSISAKYDARTSRTHTNGDYEVTETSFYDVRRKGTVSFENIPCDGSQKMDDAYMDSIEPFRMEEMKRFSTAYLPGYLAERYDVDAQACKARADERSVQSTLDATRRDVIGYTTVIPIEEKTQIHRGQVSYSLLPVWALYTKYRNKTYVFMMNGQTGKMVGDLPISYTKFFLYLFGILIAVALVLNFTGISRVLVALLFS